MTAAYRLKGIGWLAALAVVVLGFYLVSSRVATERQKLEVLNHSIQVAERDIRALETEFDTRANLAQLERWNGDTLALAAPTAAQFLQDDAALASFDPYAPGLPGAKLAALVVPALATTPSAAAGSTPDPVRVDVTTPAPAPQPVALAAAAVTRPAVARSAVARPVVSTSIAAARVVAAPVVASVAIRTVAPSGREAPAIARMAEAARATMAVSRVRPQAVAMLDRQLLSESTFGDMVSGARREAGRSN